MNIKIFKELKDKLTEELKTIAEEKAANNKAKQEAVAEGDLRENSAYHAASDNENNLARREESVMSDLEKINELIDNDCLASGFVAVTSSVTFQYLDTGKVLTKIIIPPGVIVKDERFITSDSPVGAELLDKKPGDIIEIVHKKVIRIKILEVDGFKTIE